MDQLYIWSVGVGGRLGMLHSNWVTLSIDMHGNRQIGGLSLRGSDEIIGICVCVHACVRVLVCVCVWRGQENVGQADISCWID